MSAYSVYFALENRLNKAGYGIERAEVIRDLTDGRTASLKALSSSEYFELISWMRATVDRLPEEQGHEAKQRMRRKIISLFRQMGYERELRKNGVLTRQADMERIYGWVKKYGKFHKPLNNHSGAELAQLVSQVDKMYERHLRQVDRVVRIEK